MVIYRVKPIRPLLIAPIKKNTKTCRHSPSALILPLLLLPKQYTCCSKQNTNISTPRSPNIFFWIHNTEKLLQHTFCIKRWIKLERVSFHAQQLPAATLTRPTTARQLKHWRRKERDRAFRGRDERRKKKRRRGHVTQQKRTCRRSDNDLTRATKTVFRN